MKTNTTNVIYISLARFVTCTLGLCTTLAAVAHHSPASYDQTTQSTIEGVVSEISWRNPHVYLTIDSMDRDGNAVKREIEAVAASTLITLGVQQDDLRIGERVSVRINPRRRGFDQEALGLMLTKPDGKELPLRSGLVVLPPAREQANSLAGTWSPDALAFIDLSIVAQSWPFTEAGQRAAADLAARANAAADCVPFGAPVLMMAPSVVTVAIADDNVTFYMDAASISRVIHLGVATVPDNIQPTQEGYAIGRWEGDTLVVETTAFAPDPEGLGYALPSSAQKHLLERFTLTENRRGLRYEATLEDPHYLTGPVNVSSTWAYQPDMKTSGQGCDMESAQHFNAAP